MLQKNSSLTQFYKAVLAESETKFREFLLKRKYHAKLLSIQIPQSFVCPQKQNNSGPFAASGHMVHAGGQAAHWDIQNKSTSSR